MERTRKESATIMEKAWNDVGMIGEEMRYACPKDGQKLHMGYCVLCNCWYLPNEAAWQPRLIG